MNTLSRTSSDNSHENLASRESRKSKLLVLCVDRDDDVGVKAQVRTPVLGSDACADIASRLAMADPEEADANAIFAAVKINEELKSKGHLTEVAVVAGSFKGGLEADQKLRRELLQVISRFSAEGAILVSDGVDDSEILPVLQGVVPVISTKHIVIKHSARIEETYAVFGRYLRTLVYDPRYSKFALGVPGLILMSWAILAIFQLLNLGITVTLAILGIALVVRGFELDKQSMSLSRLKLSSYIRLFSFVAGLLVIGTGAFQGFSAISPTSEYAAVISEPPKFFTLGPTLSGIFISDSLLTIWIGLGLFISGGMLSNWVKVRNVRVIRDSVALLILVFLYLPIQQFGLILTGSGNPSILIISLVFGLATTFTIVVAMYQYLKTRTKKKSDIG